MASSIFCGSLARCSVVSQFLPCHLTSLEVNETLKDYLNENKLRGKFWIKDFADLIIDRTWDELDEPNRGVNA